MKYATIGGQAVIEGIMMRNGDDYAVAVRKPDQEIEVKKDVYHGIGAKLHTKKIPVVRGVFAFIDSLALGMTTLTYSASFYEEEDEKKEVEDKDKEAKKESLLMGLTMVLSVALALGIFMVLPYLASSFFERFTESVFLISLIEGIIRVILFLLYIILISRMEDIQRTFMYHGAEHKTINCIEAGEELTPENAMKYSRLHKRCGTSFLLIVVLLSVIVHMLFFIFVPVESPVAKVVIRIALVPMIAGVAFEILQWAGKHQSKLVDIISAPGFMMQKLTTREPDETMIEVAIASIEAIYDWRQFQQEVLAGGENDEP